MKEKKTFILPIKNCLYIVKWSESKRTSVKDLNERALDGLEKWSL